AESSHGSLPPDAGGDPERQSAERPFRGLRAWLRQLTRPRNGEEDGDTLEEMIEERQEVAEPIDPQEKMLIGNILKLHELNTADVMVQRVDFGGIDGLVTIEDLIEEIVGEIEDEHDDAATPQLVQRPDGSVIADARTPIEEFEERFGLHLLDADAEEDIDTLGGLVFMLGGR